MKMIQLSQGKLAKVDDSDFGFLNQFKWSAQRIGKRYYAVRNVQDAKGVWKLQRMHALILNTPAGKHSHHINDDGLDNRRENLRVASVAQHRQADLKLRKDNTTGYRGVYAQKPFRAEISHFNRTIFIGNFDTAEEAALARDAKARELGWPEEGMNFPR